MPVVSVNWISCTAVVSCISLNRTDKSPNDGNQGLRKHLISWSADIPWYPFRPQTLQGELLWHCVEALYMTFVGGGDMLLSLPQPIRSWLTSKFARDVSKLVVWGSPDATFQLYPLETKSEAPPAPSGQPQWTWTADHLCSICGRHFCLIDLFSNLFLKSSLQFSHVVTSVTTHLCRASTFKSCCPGKMHHYLTFCWHRVLHAGMWIVKWHFRRLYFDFFI